MNDIEGDRKTQTWWNENEQSQEILGMLCGKHKHGILVSCEHKSQPEYVPGTLLKCKGYCT